MLRNSEVIETVGALRGMEEDVLKLAYTWGIIALCVPSAMANGAVFLSSGLLLGKAEPRAAYMLLGSIALADLFTSCLILIGLLYPHAARTPLTCAFLIGGEVSFSLLSMISIVLIAAERYFYIVHGIKYDNILTQNRIRLLILCSWIVAMVSGLLPELLYDMHSDASFHCRFINTNPTVVIVAASVAIPALLITVIFYSVVFIHVRKVTKAINNGNSKMKLRSVVMVFLSCVCFLVTWGPYMVTGFGYAVFCQQSQDNKTCKEMSLAVSSPLALLGFLNSILNPIIYAWWHKPFNLAMRKLICPKKMRERDRKKMYDAASIDTISEKFDM